MRQAWTKEEEQRAEKLYNDGKSFYEIAVIMGRSYDSVNAKLSRRRRTITPLPKSSFPLWDKPLKSEGDALILSDVEAPFQHSEFINRCIDLADAWGIRVLHLAGDLLHYDNLSAWGDEWTETKEDLVETVLEIIGTLKGANKEQARGRLSEAGLLNEGGLSGELAEARQIFRHFDAFSDIYVALGNHDDRYLRALGQALEPGELLHQLDRHNDARWKIAPYYYTLIETRAGIFRATHPRNAGRTAAIDLATIHHSHIVMGHSHRWSINLDPSAKYWCIQTGHCVDEKRLAYVMQRDSKRDAHALGATIIRDGYPFVLREESPWDLLKRM